MVNGPDFSDDARVDELRHLDAFGHGTHLAGIIAAVAPQARVVNVKVADHEGNTSLGNLLAGIDWATRRGDRRGLDVRVLNLAFGAEADGSYRNDPLAYAVEQAWDEGLVVITSAGNGGNDSDSLDSPAYDPYVVAVGAEDSGATATLADDGMAPFSSRGSDTRGPDVVAPGVAVLSTRVPGSFLDEAFPAARIGEGFRGSGTSQSAAVVSGAAALLVGARPGLEPDQVKALLRSTARPLADTDTALQGAGVIDVAAASRSAAPTVRQRFPNARRGGGCAAGFATSMRSRTPAAIAGAVTAGAVIAGAAIAGAAIAGAAIAGRATAGRAIAGRATAGRATAGRVSIGEGDRDEWS